MPYGDYGRNSYYNRWKKSSSYDYYPSKRKTILSQEERGEDDEGRKILKNIKTEIVMTRGDLKNISTNELEASIRKEKMILINHVYQVFNDILCGCSEAPNTKFKELLSQTVDSAIENDVKSEKVSLLSLITKFIPSRVYENDMTALNEAEQTTPAQQAVNVDTLMKDLIESGEKKEVKEIEESKPPFDLDGTEEIKESEEKEFK